MDNTPPITPVEVDGVVVGWVEYHGGDDVWRARVRGDSAGQTFHDEDAAAQWVREQYQESQQQT